MAELDIAAIIVAIISFTTSVIVAILTHIFNSRHNKEMEGIRTKYGKELEEFKSRLEAEKDERTAFRDYQYEARKRLYQEFEPVLF